MTKTFRNALLGRKSLLGLVAAGLLASTILTGVVPQAFEAQAQTQQVQQGGAIDPSRGFSELVDRVMPAVVSVQVKFTNAAASSEEAEQVPEQFKEFFDRFPQFRERFGEQRREQPRQGGGLGSGFVISDDGYVVTNNHVVEKADEVKVTFENGTSFDAKVIGTDPKTDLALLKIQSDKKFPTVPFTDSEAKVGDWVMAVGNPFGLGGTVTQGIVSARGRNIGSGPYDDYLQIDASINRGNSGGPAFNLEGEVIGVNTAIFSPSGGSVGIGFAIPASLVKNVVESLKADGAVTRGWLGVRIQPVTEELAEGLGLKEARGAVVSDLTEKSPALEAGIKQGDTILDFNGQAIKDSRDLSKVVASVKPGTEVPINLIRDGKAMALTVKIGVMPNDTPRMAGQAEAPSNALAGLGLEVAPADDGAGVKVLKVDPKSVAAEKGIKAGDTILEVAGTEVNSPSDVSKALKAEDGKRVLMLVKQGDDQRFVALPKAKG
jgi:serine protease Do